MASTKFFLDMRGKAADGKGSIILQLFHNRTMTSISTGIRLSPSEWDGKRVIKVSGAEAINATLTEQKGKIDRAIALLSLEDNFGNMTASELKALIAGGKPKTVTGHLISELFYEYMDTAGLKDGTKSIYRSTLKKVIGYGGEKTRIENIDLKWLRQFDKYLAKTQGVNGRAIYMRSLRAVCNYAIHAGVIKSYPFINYQVKQEPTQKRSVPVEVMREFLSFPVNEIVKKYRDYFLLMFYLIGINTKDLLLAKKEQVVNGRLEYIREKTGKKYSIKIEPEAEELIARYSGCGQYLLEAMDHCKHHQNFGRQINEFIQMVGPEVEVLVPTDDLFAEPEYKKEIQPIIPGVTTYFARHCWATFAYEIGISIDVISQALGHSFGNRTTLIYVKPNQEKVDEANRMVMDYLIQGA